MNKLYCLQLRLYNLRSALLIGLIACLALSMFASEKVIRVGMYQNPPKIFIDDSGKPAGIFVDVLASIAHKEDWQINYINGTWAEGLQRLSSGEIDLMPDVGYSSARDKIYSFHQLSVLSAWSQFYGRKGMAVSSILDLEGKSVAVLKGSIQQATIETMARGFGLKIKIVETPTLEDAFQTVKNGGANVAVTNNYYGSLNSRRHNLEAMPVVFEPLNFYFATKKGTNLDLLLAIDKNMEILQSTPLSDYYQSIKRWTSEEVKYRLPTWVTLLGMGIILILLISIVIALLFEKQVRKRTAELREINREMENRIIDRTAELSVAMQKAQQADILKSAFLATMSHELRTPLNSIIGFTGILMKQIPGKLNEEQTKQLGLVQKSSRHLLTLINDILDISKIEAGQLELNCQEFRLEETLSKVASLVQPQVDKKHLELVVDVLDKPCPINTDQRRFEQVLLNLLSNAIKFTETGRITLSCKIVKGLYRVTVQDTGIGIPASEHANLFQPFHQIDSGLTRKYDGTGLGLSITFNLIKMMGGNLTLESEAGKGSSFSFALPVPNEELT